MTLNIYTSSYSPSHGGINQSHSSLRQSLLNLTSKSVVSSDGGMKVNLPTDFNLRVTEAFTAEEYPKISELKINPYVHKLTSQRVEALL
jgi:hypothetical protein